MELGAFEASVPGSKERPALELTTWGLQRRPTAMECRENGEEIPERFGLDNREHLLPDSWVLVHKP